MSADIISMAAVRARRPFFATRREDERHLRVAEARKRYAEAYDACNRTFSMCDAIEAAREAVARVRAKLRAETEGAV